MRVSGRIALVVAIAIVAAVVARIASPSGNRPARISAALACGVERWKIKTLQDRPHLSPVRATTLAHLVGLSRPGLVPQSRRLGSERTVYSVVAAVTLDRHEADSDLHLVLQSGTSHLIAESPSLGCVRGATAGRRRQMRSARSAARLCSRARVVGVAFWDYYHGQTGAAPNGLELHPVLGFKCLSGGPAPPPPPPPGPSCAASYPDACIPPPPPDLNCADVPYRNFRVRWDVADPDPHHFDGDRDGIGCES